MFACSRGYRLPSELLRCASLTTAIAYPPWGPDHFYCLLLGEDVEVPCLLTRRPIHGRCYYNAPSFDPLPTDRHPLYPCAPPSIPPQTGPLGEHALRKVSLFRVEAQGRAVTES